MLDKIVIENNEIIKIKITDLKPHPRNKEIYGNKENVSDLIESIEKYGIKQALTVNTDNVIIFGHRRYLAAMKIGLNEVPVIIKNFKTKEDELEALVLDNVYRNKTTKQKVKEGEILEEVIAERARQRMEAGVKVDPMDESSIGSEKGTTRDEVASKVGFKSGRQYTRAKNVVKKIDELEESGNADDAELISEILNQAPSTAEEFVNKIDVTKLDDDIKSKIRSGEISAHSLVKKEKKPESFNQSTKTAEIKVTDEEILAETKLYWDFSEGKTDDLGLPEYKETYEKIVGDVRDELLKNTIFVKDALQKIETTEIDLNVDKSELIKLFKVFEKEFKTLKNKIIGGKSNG